MSDKNEKFNYQANEQQDRTDLRKHLKELLSDLIQQDFVNKETGLVATLTSDDVNKISSNEAISKSKTNDYTQEEHFKVAEDITNLYENATLKETHKDYKERPNITNVHRFNINVEVNSKDTTVKITMFERVDGKNRIYTLELQKLDPLHNISRVSETEVAESLSSEVASHNDPSIYCDSSSVDNITKKQTSQAQEKADLLLKENSNLKQITKDTAVLAPQSSALLIKTYEQLGDEELAHTLINTIESDKVTMQEVNKHYLALDNNVDELKAQLSEGVGENKNSQESDKKDKATPKPKIKTMFGKKNNGENND